MTTGILEKRVNDAQLLACYGQLLTGIRRDIAHLYLEEDWSLSEIANHMSISRQAVHEALVKARSQLRAMESKLGHSGMFTKIRRDVLEVSALLQSGHVGEASKLINKMARDSEDTYGV